MSCVIFLDIFVHYYKILPGISGHEATGCSKVQPRTTFLSLGRHRCLAQEGSSPGRNMWFLHVSFVAMYCTMYTLFFTQLINYIFFCIFLCRGVLLTSAPSALLHVECRTCVGVVVFLPCAISAHRCFCPPLLRPGRCIVSFSAACVQLFCS